MQIFRYCWVDPTAKGCRKQFPSLWIASISSLLLKVTPSLATRLPLHGCRTSPKNTYFNGVWFGFARGVASSVSSSENQPQSSYSQHRHWPAARGAAGMGSRRGRGVFSIACLHLEWVKITRNCTLG